MQHATSSPTGSRIGRLSTFVVLSVVVLTFAFEPSWGAKGKKKKAKGGGGDSSESVAANPHADVLALGFKFDGANACSSTECHGAAEPKAGKERNSAEYTLWSAKDDHETGHKTLGNKDSKKIAKALNIKSAAKSDRCLSCHAVDVPENLQGVDYKVKEGVTCAACHGPSEKWLEPHKEEGWTQARREELGPEKLLSEWGLFDTKSPLARANKCTSCHLAIDADMVAAGHPQPKFELDYYSRSDQAGGIYVSRHWRDPEVPYYSVQLWATGQAVALRDALAQLAAREAAGADEEAVTSARNQAMGHFRMVAAMAEAGVVKPESGEWTTAATDLPSVEDAAALVPAVAALEPDADATLSLLKAVASVEGMSDLGERGMEQQAYAIYSLYGAHANKGAPVEKDDKTGAMIAKNILPRRKTGKKEPKPITADEFNKGLEAVRGALPS